MSSMNRWTALLTILNSIKSERKNLSAWVMTRSSYRRATHANSPKINQEVSTMYYIGIDVSKKALSVFDGVNDLEFKNNEGLKAFKRYLKKRYKSFDNIGILFESTGIYSDHLQTFCARHQLRPALRRAMTLTTTATAQ